MSLEIRMHEKYEMITRVPTSLDISINRLLVAVYLTYCFVSDKINYL